MALKLLPTVYLITRLFNAFLYGATSSISNQSLLITHAPHNALIAQIYYKVC